MNNALTYIAAQPSIPDSPPVQKYYFPCRYRSNLMVEAQQKLVLYYMDSLLKKYSASYMEYTYCYNVA